ncbi:MAG: hypothetical protein ACR2K4_07470, partial [Candidatus Limnocylindria bacterium]
MTAETLLPPRTSIGPIGWLRKNLFSGPINSVITILLALVLGWLLIQIGGWVLTEARWNVVSNNLRLFLVGQYPDDQVWRIWLTMAILSLFTGLSAGVYGQAARTMAATLSAIQVMIGLLILVSPIGIVGVVAYLGNAALVWAAFAAAVRVTVPRRLLI